MVTPFTEKEIKALKEKLTTKEDLSDLKVKDLKMADIIPQSLNGVIITKLDGYHTLMLPDFMDQGKFKTWLKSSAGMFSKDALNYLRGKEHGKYVLIEGNGERKIVRLIEDDELHLFKSLRLVKGIVKDKPFMTVRDLDENDKLTSNKRYIKENSEIVELEETMAVNPQPLPGVEDDHESLGSSVSLFDE